MKWFDHGGGRDSSRATFAHAIAAVLSTACGACTAFEGLGLATTGAVRDDAATCRHAEVLPVQSWEHMGPAIEIVVAVHRYGYSDRDGGVQSIGFDLDHACTAENAGSSCIEPPGVVHLDGPEGRDNSVMSDYLSSATGQAAHAQQVEDAVNSGLVAIVLRIRGYDGDYVDNTVSVELFVATRSPDVLHSLPNPPVWDGADEWTPLAEWTRPGGADGGPAWAAKYVSSDAYVAAPHGADSVLVAHFDLARCATAFDFSDVWLQAKIEHTAGDPWTLRDGVFAGRVRPDDLLASLDFSPLPSISPKVTCTDSSEYPDTKRKLCALADIQYSGNDDDPAAPCDAASWQWTFDADQAVLSNEVSPITIDELHQCPVGTRPSEDHCPAVGSGL